MYVYSYRSFLTSITSVNYYLKAREKLTDVIGTQKIEQEIGRIPVGMRQHTRNFMFFNNGGGAYAQAGDVTFLGNISPTVVLVSIFESHIP